MENKKITVAIDGYSSSGKSTMARRLAASVGYRYIVQLRCMLSNTA